MFFFSWVVVKGQSKGVTKRSSTRSMFILTLHFAYLSNRSFNKWDKKNIFKIFSRQKGEKKCLKELKLNIPQASHTN